MHANSNFLPIHTQTPVEIDSERINILNVYNTTGLQFSFPWSMILWHWNGYECFLWMCDDVYATRNTVISPPATYLHFLLPALFSAPILLAHISKEFNTHKMQQKWYSRKESSDWIDINSEGDSLTSLKVLWNSQARILFILVFKWWYFCVDWLIWFQHIIL